MLRGHHLHYLCFPTSLRSSERNGRGKADLSNVEPDSLGYSEVKVECKDVEKTEVMSSRMVDSNGNELYKRAKSMHYLECIDRVGYNALCIMSEPKV